MKRDQALINLSHDHHQCLSVAHQLGHVTPETAGEARAAFLAYWEQQGEAHLRLEEEVLLPAFAAHGDPYHPLVARTLCDHAVLRHRAVALACNPTATVGQLHGIGARLEDHIRREERELFPMIERAMPPDQLAALGDALRHAELGRR